MKKRTVFILFGGKSSEYEVSLASAHSVLSAIDEAEWDVIKIGITRDGKWYRFFGENEEILKDIWHKNSKNKPLCVDFSRKCFVSEGEELKADIAFAVMHGEYGEDGRIQSLFELLEIELVGPDSFSASLCMDKQLCKTVAMREGIPVAPYTELTKRQFEESDSLWAELEGLGDDIFIKPSRAGSSVGITHIHAENELNAALLNAFSVCDRVLAEKAIHGNECEVAILENGSGIIVSEVGKIVHKSDFYDYETKYHSDGVEYEIPAKIPEECRLLCKNYAMELYRALGCGGLCRFDFFVTEHEVIFNEVNAIPGFTSGSMYPMLMRKAGYSLSGLVSALLSKSKKSTQNC